MLEERSGSIFDAPVRAFVNAVNCEGISGKDLALEFKNRFPEAYEDYRMACLRKALAPGTLHTFWNQDGTRIVNFPTKTLWRSPSKIEYIESGLPALVEWVQLNAIESIAVPALGCGLGGLPWRNVKQRFRPGDRVYVMASGGRSSSTIRLTMAE
jgi:O-acetyl-ADP-ribose deacetylase (regulator of RNase III)